ncbi:hypothetical protein J6590_101538 [Homalodisca vitripennis]|nr:hypothetical protein J6590_101538 [Homalodisca vitripennis]
MYTAPVAAAEALMSLANFGTLRLIRLDPELGHRPSRGALLPDRAARGHAATPPDNARHVTAVTNHRLIGNECRRSFLALSPRSIIKKGMGLLWMLRTPRRGETLLKSNLLSSPSIPSLALVTKAALGSPPLTRACRCSLSHSLSPSPFSPCFPHTAVLLFFTAAAKDGRPARISAPSVGLAVSRGCMHVTRPAQSPQLP